MRPKEPCVVGVFVLALTLQPLTNSRRELSLSSVQNPCVSALSPAVYHYGPGIWGVEKLDLSYEAQQSCGITGNAVVGPTGEMKLTELADLMMALLKKKSTRSGVMLSFIFYNGSCREIVCLFVKSVGHFLS